MEDYTAPPEKVGEHTSPVFPTKLRPCHGQFLS